MEIFSSVCPSFGCPGGSWPQAHQNWSCLRLRSGSLTAQFHSTREVGGCRAFIPAHQMRSSLGAHPSPHLAMWNPELSKCPDRSCDWVFSTLLCAYRKSREGSYTESFGEQPECTWNYSCLRRGWRDFCSGSEQNRAKGYKGSGLLETPPTL